MGCCREILRGEGEVLRIVGRGERVGGYKTEKMAGEE